MTRYVRALKAAQNIELCSTPYEKYKAYVATYGDSPWLIPKECNAELCDTQYAQILQTHAIEFQEAQKREHIKYHSRCGWVITSQGKQFLRQLKGDFS